MTSPEPCTAAPTDEELVRAIAAGDRGQLELLVQRYSPRLFGMARRYARQEREVEDIVQEIWLKAYTKLQSFRQDAPFEHWLMRLGLHTCYDYLRRRKRRRECTFSELTGEETEWLDSFAAAPDATSESAAAARQLLARVFEELSPAARLVIQLLEIEELPVKEIARLMGWSVPLVKVRAFRARAEMRRILTRITTQGYL